MNRVAAAFVLIVVCFVGSPVFGADAFVATTAPVVHVNSGSGYSAVSILKPVRAGDQIITDENGSGWIIYCGCDVEIAPGPVYTVENRECKVESVRVEEPGLPHIVVQPDGQRGEEELEDRCRRPAAAWGLLGGGVAAGAGICAVAGCFDGDDDDRPASP